MADYGFCKNCKNMNALTFTGKCKKCGGEVDSLTILKDTLWNKKTDSEKKAFLQGLVDEHKGFSKTPTKLNAQPTFQKVEEESYSSRHTRLSKYSDSQLNNIIYNSNMDDDKEVARKILKERNAEKERKEQSERRQQEEHQKIMAERAAITTCPTFENKKIKKYLGTVSGTEIYLVGGLVGGGFGNQEKLFGNAFQIAKDRMYAKAKRLGGNGVVGMQTVFTSPGNLNYMIVLVTGTAVLLSEED